MEIVNYLKYEDKIFLPAVEVLAGPWLDAEEPAPSAGSWSEVSQRPPALLCGSMFSVHYSAYLPDNYAHC